MNENPFSNQEIHVLFEHGSGLENTENEPCIICMTLYTEGTVSGSGTGPLDHGATGPVPDTEPRLWGLSRGPVVLGTSRDTGMRVRTCTYM